MAEAGFFPEAGEGGGGGLDGFFFSASFLAELGEVFESDFFLVDAVGEEVLGFWDEFGAVEVEKALVGGGAEGGRG